MDVALNELPASVQWYCEKVLRYYMSRPHYSCVCAHAWTVADNETKANAFPIESEVSFPRKHSWITDIVASAAELMKNVTSKHNTGMLRVKIQTSTWGIHGMALAMNFIEGEPLLPHRLMDTIETCEFVATKVLQRAQHALRSGNIKSN
eukprot:5365746-Amphidinium_carterae.1